MDWRRTELVWVWAVVVAGGVIEAVDFVVVVAGGVAVATGFGVDFSGRDAVLVTVTGGEAMVVGVETTIVGAG